MKKIVYNGSPRSFFKKNIEKPNFHSPYKPIYLQYPVQNQTNNRPIKNRFPYRNINYYSLNPSQNFRANNQKPYSNTIVENYKALKSFRINNRSPYKRIVDQSNSPYQSFRYNNRSVYKNRKNFLAGPTRFNPGSPYKNNNVFGYPIRTNNQSAFLEPIETDKPKNFYTDSFWKNK